MANRVAGVYRIRNLVSGSFYIGSSEDVYRRFEAHRRQLRAGNHKNRGLQQSWAKHGEDVFKFEVLEKVEVGLLRDAEKRYLVPMFSHPKCTNMHDETYTYPRTGRKHSDATKAKISAKVQAALAAGKGGKFIPSAETRAKMSAANRGNPGPKGHIRTEEHRQRLSEANKGNQNWLGKKHSEESCAKMGRAVIATNPYGEERRYATITALRAELGLTPPTVHRGLKSGKPLSGGKCAGWSFRYAVN